MKEEIVLYSFGFNDRSGKVRWLAEELGLSIDEQNIELGENRKPEYREINPYASIPTTVYQGETLVESTATCIHLAEVHPESQLAVFAKDGSRYNYLHWISVFSETLEGKLVDCILANYGLMPETVKSIYEKTIRFKLKVVLQQIPNDGFLVASRLTIADIVAAYSLKIAVQLGYVDWHEVKGYLQPLMERPAAKRAKFFSSLEEFLIKAGS